MRACLAQSRLARSQRLLLTLAFAQPNAAGAATRSPYAYPFLLVGMVLLGLVLPPVGMVALTLLAIWGVMVLIGRFPRSASAVLLGRVGSADQLRPYAILDIAAGAGLTFAVAMAGLYNRPSPDSTRGAAGSQPPTSRVDMEDAKPMPAAPRHLVKMNWAEAVAWLGGRGYATRAIRIEGDGTKLRADRNAESLTLFFDREGDPNPPRAIEIGFVPIGALHDALELYMGVRAEHIPDRARRDGVDSVSEVPELRPGEWVVEQSYVELDPKRDVFICDAERFVDCRGL